MATEYTNVTDGQADTAWRNRPCWCIASRDKTLVVDSPSRGPPPAGGGAMPPAGGA